MSNSVETVTMPEGVVSFDHSTGVMKANWNNGYSETWPRRGYSIEQKRHSFYFFTEQWEKIGYANN